MRLCELKKGNKVMQIFLGLGSNLGDCGENLLRAINHLSPVVQVLNRSSACWTAPQYKTDQPQFLNQVIEGETALTATELLTFLKQLEKKMGRSIGVRYGPRLIDIDILYYGQEIIQTAQLTIPHRELYKRSFVLVPLCEIAPDFVCPLEKKTVRQMLEELENFQTTPWKGGY